MTAQGGAGHLDENEYMRPLRVFVDTSVFGGMFDIEFEADTRAFFKEVAAGNFSLAVSKQVYDEIVPAPGQVKSFFDALLPQMVLFNDSPEVQYLVEVYLDKKVVGRKSLNDALHVAYATVHGCSGLVSWNFKHIISEDKSLAFNLANTEQGYPQIFIASPREIVRHGNARRG